MLSPANPMNLAPATVAALRQGNMPTDALSLTSITADDLLSVPGIGFARLTEIRNAMGRSGLTLNGDAPDLPAIIARLATCIVVTEINGRPVLAIGTDRPSARDDAHQLATLIGVMSGVEVVTEATYRSKHRRTHPAWRNGGRSGRGEKPHAR